ncbi:MAG: hypothetical protein SWH61_16965 [Thermodesulfobacteriota bacterium]|nr:hypothetical protein [Thermodesulfobacteriota bacterium]
MKKLFVAVIVLFLFPVNGIAQEQPTGEEANRVINYYFNGQGYGALLMESKLCREIAEEGPYKNECINAVSDNMVKKGEDVDVWMKFLVPEGDEANIMVSFSIDGRVRKVEKTTVSGSIRWRTWKAIPTYRTGDWSVIILQEMADQDVQLGTFEYTVVGQE